MQLRLVFAIALVSLLYGSLCLAAFQKCHRARTTLDYTTNETFCYSIFQFSTANFLASDGVNPFQQSAVTRECAQTQFVLNGITRNGSVLSINSANERTFVRRIVKRYVQQMNINDGPNGDLLWKQIYLGVDAGGFFDRSATVHIDAMLPGYTTMSGCLYLEYSTAVFEAKDCLRKNSYSGGKSTLMVCKGRFDGALVPAILSSRLGKHRTATFAWWQRTSGSGESRGEENLAWIVILPLIAFLVVFAVPIICARLF